MRLKEFGVFLENNSEGIASFIVSKVSPTVAGISPKSYREQKGFIIGLMTGIELIAQLAQNNNGNTFVNLEKYQKEYRSREKEFVAPVDIRHFGPVRND